MKHFYEEYKSWVLSRLAFLICESGLTPWCFGKDNRNVSVKYCRITSGDCEMRSVFWSLESALEWNRCGCLPRV